VFICHLLFINRAWRKNGRRYRDHRYGLQKKRWSGTRHTNELGERVAYNRYVCSTAKKYGAKVCGTHLIREDVYKIKNRSACWETSLCEHAVHIKAERTYIGAI
jgi:hypothetical protein